MPPRTSPVLSSESDEESMSVSGLDLLLPFGVTFSSYTVCRAQGVYLYTDDNKRLLDWSSGQMASVLGHSHPAVTSAIISGAQNLDHLLSCNVSPPVLELAGRLANILPPSLNRSMFLTTGSEACEAAIRIAKLVTGRYEVVGVGSSWHGMTAGSLGAQYCSGRKGYGPTLPGNFRLPSPNAYRSVFRNGDGTYDWQSELEYGLAAVDEASSGSLAAMIVEPVLSSGGMLTPPKGYLRALKHHCEKRGMLLIVDEAQTGLGRCGTMWGFEEDGIVPDILVLSKTLGAGFPLSAVITSSGISNVCTARGYFFCTTHVNDPLAARVGCAVTKTVVEQNLVDRARILGKILISGLQDLKRRYGCIGDVRGRGMLTAIEIVSDQASKKPAADLARRIAMRMFELGLSVNLTYSDRLFRIAPPLTITQEQLEEGLRIMDQSLGETPGSLPLDDVLN